MGIAAIQVCQYLGAEVGCDHDFSISFYSRLQIYVTAGSEEKRKFLIETYGIPTTHVFSSRSTAFSPMLMTVTHGKGVDVILNSLSGGMLDESWRCIADGGTMIEIGKKDMIDRNALSMEPFTRMASYRAVDISHDCIPLSIIAR